MTQETSSADKPTKNWTVGGVLLLIGIGVLVAVNDDERGLSGEIKADGFAFSSDLPDDAAVEVADAASTPMQLARAADHAGRTIGAMGSEGATFYSERCYEALRLAFNPLSLDRCYAFDMFAERLIEKENVAYFYPRFWPENTRERWNQAVQEAGVQPINFATRRDALEKNLDAITVTPITPPQANVYKPSETQSTDHVQDQPPTGADELWDMPFEGGNFLPDAPANQSEAQLDAIDG